MFEVVVKKPDSSSVVYFFETSYIENARLKPQLDNKHTTMIKLPKIRIYH